MNGNGEFGDGIMSAISFRPDACREPDPASGDTQREVPARSVVNLAPPLAAMGRGQATAAEKSPASSLSDAVYPRLSVVGCYVRDPTHLDRGGLTGP